MRGQVCIRSQRERDKAETEMGPEVTGEVGNGVSEVEVSQLGDHRYFFGVWDVRWPRQIEVTTSRYMDTTYILGTLSRLQPQDYHEL